MILKNFFFYKLFYLKIRKNVYIYIYYFNLIQFNQKNKITHQFILWFPYIIYLIVNGLLRYSYNTYIFIIGWWKLLSSGMENYLFVSSYFFDTIYSAIADDDPVWLWSLWCDFFFRSLRIKYN
jgi:hypothetical protein